MIRGFNSDGMIVAGRPAHNVRSGLAFCAELNSPELGGLLNQLTDEGLAHEASDSWLVPWRQLYSLLGSPADENETAILAVPPVTSAAPILLSHGSLTDSTFAVWIDGWHDGSGGRLEALSRVGAVLETRAGSVQLLNLATWELCQKIEAFRMRGDGQRCAQAQRRAWGQIRSLALQCNCRLDNFLLNTIVLTPEKLRLGMRSHSTGIGRVVEIIPGFEGEPDHWLKTFDGRSIVPDRYDLSTTDGIVQVVIEPSVKTVLQQIKQMPSRRVAGSRAEAFLVNPFATLGDVAHDVLDESQFEAAREQAGVSFCRFTPFVERNDLGRIASAGILIHSAGTADGTREIFHTPDRLSQFTEALQQRILKNLPLLAWEAYEFELTGDASSYLGTLESALSEMRQPPILVDYKSVYSLDHYSSRIEGIGLETPDLSPYIAKMDPSKGWFPDNVIPFVHINGNHETKGQDCRVTANLLTGLRNGIATAISLGQQVVSVPGLPKPLPLPEAMRILKTFDAVKKDLRTGSFTAEPATKPIGKNSLLIKPNIDVVGYAEPAGPIPADLGIGPMLPKSLLPEARLKSHQMEGVARLQALFRLGPKHCRGVILADDMGLGKTLQLLTVIAEAFEQDPELEPALVVAPVSLLENWEEEIGKFFQRGSLTVRTAYGESLRSWRVPKESIDAQLHAEGLVKFLRAGWTDGVRIVLTTYETLRDLEFSFAERKWSIMVCDEAQKIKNPNALVTRAAKKQNVRFRVACTGTPVENSLVDLWCLFDFIQPGFLGALSAFGELYRRPIEARTEQERQRVEELRAKIAPQIIRRTKAEVMADLPKKLEHHSLVPISAFQRSLYTEAIQQFKNRSTATNAPIKHHLGLLQYLRGICTDPDGPSLVGLSWPPIKEYQAKAPKLQWLLGILEEVRTRQEKAIVFCEFRAIQRLLRHYIEEALHYTADIINGDTETNRSSSESRHKRLKAFQATAGFGVIILSPVAVGFGVNVQAANHVIHYTRTWNPAKEDQATDRAYRIGQEKDVMVYYPILHAPDFITFDVRLDELLKRKRELAQDMLNGTGELEAAEFDLDCWMD
jgi:hypothetical protein